MTLDNALGKLNDHFSFSAILKEITLTYNRDRKSKVIEINYFEIKQIKGVKPHCSLN